jgi:hypothetical protein
MSIREGVIGAEIARTNRNLLLSGLVLIGAVALAVAATARYWYDFALGPFPADEAALAAIKDAGEPLKYWLTVKGERTVDTGITRVETTKDKYSGRVKSERTVAKYLALIVGDRLLIVRASPSAREGTTQFTGSLARHAGDVQARVAGEIRRQDAGLTLYPYMLEADDGFRTPGYVGIAIGGLALLIGARNVKKAVERWADPTRHPASVALAAHGDAGELAAKLDAEAAGAGVSRIGGVTVTASWLLRRTAFALRPVRLEDVVWVHKKVTKHSVNFIPTGKTYEAVIVDRSGGSVSVQANEARTNQLLEHVTRRAPWAIGGWSQDLAAAWKSNRASVVAAVDERRKKLAAAAAAAAATPGGA